MQSGFWLGWEDIHGQDGVEFIPLPAELQTTDFVFAAGIATSAKELEAAKALIRALYAPAAAPVIKANNMEPD